MITMVIFAPPGDQQSFELIFTAINLSAAWWVVTNEDLITEMFILTTLAFCLAANIRVVFFQKE